MSINFQQFNVLVSNSGEYSNSLEVVIKLTIYPFQNNNLVHNSFNFQQYICYTILLNMFRAARCSSSGGPIVSITTASGIVTLCKQPYSMQVESGLQSALHLHTVQLLTEGDDTRGCGDTVGPPDDEQRAARNMLRSIV